MAFALKTKITNYRKEELEAIATVLDMGFVVTTEGMGITLAHGSFGYEVYISEASTHEYENLKAALRKFDKEEEKE